MDFKLLENKHWKSDGPHTNARRMQQLLWATEVARQQIVGSRCEGVIKGRLPILYKRPLLVKGKPVLKFVVIVSFGKGGKLK